MRKWNLVYHIKFLDHNIKKFQNELLSLGHSFKTQYNAETHLKEKYYPSGTFHCAYVNQWPYAAHLNMSNVFNFYATKSNISDKSKSVIPLQFQKKHNISVKTLVDLFDMSHKPNTHKPKWNLLTTKYKSFANIPYLVRNETGEQLIICRNIPGYKSNVKNMQHILNLYKPDIIINGETPSKNMLSNYFTLSKNETFGSEIVSTAMKYAIKNNNNILLCDISEKLNENLKIFARYFDMFQLQMLHSLSKPDVTQCILDLKYNAEKILSNEILSNQEPIMSTELANVVLRRLYPHQYMYNVYRDEVIVYGIENCMNAFPNKQNKKLLVILGEDHSDEVIKRLTEEKSIENIVYNCTHNQASLQIDRDTYTNWPAYDELYLKDDLHFLHHFTAAGAWKKDPLKLVTMFLFGHGCKKNLKYDTL
eukprot:481520_1